MKILLRFRISFATLLLASGISGCSKFGPPDVRLEDPLVQIVSTTPAHPRVHSFVGLVAARVESPIGIRIPGKVIERLVNQGQDVKTGQVLLRLDDTDLQHEILNLQGEVDSDQALATDAVADEGRDRPLRASGAISEQEYDSTKSKMDSAIAKLTAAKARLLTAKDNLQYAELTADSDGLVMEIRVEPGQVVGAGEVVVMIAHSGPHEAVINLPENLYPALGSSAIATTPGLGTAKFPARLRQLSKSADPATRTFEARYVIDSGTTNIPLGTTINVELKEAPEKFMFQVPNSALYDPGQGPGIWFLDKTNSSVTFRSIHIVELGQENACVQGNLNAGDEIVALGGNLLHEGEKVRAVDGAGQ